MTGIKLVSIDINKNDYHFDDFNNKSVKEKIAKLESSIIKICEQLKTIDPGSPWILTWREYSITNPDSKIISVEDKRLYRSALHELSKKYAPNLTIIAGTVATERVKSDPDTLDKLDTYYQAHAWVKDAEKDFVENSRHFTKEENKRNALKSKKDKIKDHLIIRNTCYCFNGDNINRHDKVTPFDETFDDQEKEKIEKLNKLNLSAGTAPISAPFALFQPGKGRNLPSLVTIKHPTSNEEITLGIEICREHALGLLQHLNEKPFIHLILSDSVPLVPNNFVANYVLHVDSEYKPRLFTPRSASSSLPVEHYQFNLLDPMAKLVGPLKPENPFELKIANLVQEEIGHKKMSAQEEADVLLVLKAFTERSAELYRDMPTLADELRSFTRHLRTDSKSSEIDQLAKKIYQLIDEQDKLFYPYSYLHNIDDAHLWQTDPAAYFTTLLAKELTTKALDQFYKFKFLDNFPLTASQACTLVEGIEDSKKTTIEKSDAYDMLYEKIKHLLEDTSDPKLGGECIIHTLCKDDKRTGAIMALFDIPNINFNIQDINTGNTPLHIALKYDLDAEVILKLIDHGADPTIKNNKGKTAFDLADPDDLDVQKILKDALPKLPKP